MLNKIFPVIFAVMFVCFTGFFLVNVFRGISQWHKNNQSPKLTVSAVIVGRRSETHTHHQQSGGVTHSTIYYVTFQVESGDRMEFLVSGSDYGMFCEGDEGKLSFQGTRFLQFERS